MIDFVSKVVTVGENRVELTPLEYGVLAYLARNRDRYVSPEELLSEVWGRSSRERGRGNEVRSVIKRLRRKIGARTGWPTPIRTSRSWGYALRSSTAPHWQE
jgi:DNA-binding response OmpR family regulator